MIKTAVFISGSGSNLQAIIDQWELGGTMYDLKLVFSNVADAYGIERAKKAGIDVACFSHKDYESREAFDDSVQALLIEKGIELIALAGFMRLLTPKFVEQWQGRMINIHPSLLPSFPGLHTHRKALEYGVKFSGCSVFYVDEGVDTGQIINQACVKVLGGDTEETLAKRVLKEEHRIFPAALEEVAQNLNEKK